MPVADPVIPVLAEQMRQYRPVPVTLPWGTPDGKPVSRELLFATPDGRALNRNAFNRLWRNAWHGAGIDPARGRQNGCQALRHTAASAWLSAGVLAAYLSAHRTMINGSALWRMRAASSAPASLVLAPALLLFGPCNPAARARADA